MDPMRLYRAARSAEGASSGYYNRNIRMDDDGRPVIIRFPLPDSDMVDLKLWPEGELLTAICPYVRHAQRLLHASTDPDFQIHEFVDGDLLESVAPVGKPVPTGLIRDALALFAELIRVPAEVLPAKNQSWPEDGDTPAFAERLSEVSTGIHRDFMSRHPGLLSDLGIPADPLGPLLTRWRDLRSRPFRLVHCDVHRKNIILRRGGGEAVFIDWQLALWGDPLYELASHIHKMGYLPHEREQVVAGWVDIVPPECSVGWRGDLQIYLAHERVKSAFVDGVRYTGLYAKTPVSGGRRRAIAERLAAKLAAARPYLGNQPLSVPRIEEIMRARADEAAIARPASSASPER